METAALTVHEPTRIPAELEKAASETGLSTEGVNSLKTGFAPHFNAFQHLQLEAANVGPGQPQAARVVRLALKAVRVAADKTRAELKADSLRRGKAIDGINALLEYQLVPVEKAMQAIEDAEEIAAKELLRVLAETRRAELAPFVADTSFYDLGAMPDATYAQLLSSSKAGYLQRQRDAADAEAARVAAEKAASEAAAKRKGDEAFERARMEAEIERLAKVAAEERAEREQAEAAAKLERDRAELAARAEREKADAEARRVAAIAKAEADRHAADLAAERARTAKLEQEARDRAAAEAKAEADRLAAETETRRVAAVAPDREKVRAMAQALRGIAAPVLASNPALSEKIAEQLRKFTAWLESEGAKL